MTTRARCEKCHVTIESKSRHDFAQCICGAIFVDGGSEYSRYGYDDPAHMTMIYPDGSEESMVESIRRYNEENPTDQMQAGDSMLSFTIEPELSPTEKTDKLLEEILAKLHDLEGLLHECQ